MRTSFIRHIIFFFLVCFLIGHGQIFAQATTKIMGTVRDVETSEVLPFVNISFKGTTIGATTDFDGNYSIETRTPSDSLTASYVGYLAQSQKIYKGKFQTIDFFLKPVALKLKEVVITYTGNPAEEIMKKVSQNRSNNDREKWQTYQYESYNKIEFDANNLTEKFRNQRALRQFKFVFDNIDTSTVNGKSYLPIFLSESISDIYYRKNPRARKEIIKANKISGVENQSVSQFLGDMYQNVNIYDNFINLFDKNFISPTSNIGLFYYKYYLVDSSFHDNQWCYKIMFKPRRKQELTFTGSLIIHDTTFAVKEFEMKMAEDANINFVHDLYARQEFKLFDNKYWIVVKEQMVVDFNIINKTKKTMGMYGRKTTTYKDYKINEPIANKLFDGAMDIISLDSSAKRNETYWKNARHDSLSKDEKGIYTMIDTIKKLPAFNTYVDIITTVMTGYKIWGNFELGPYYKTISFNDIEGARFRLGGRTSNAFSTKIMPEGYVAFGTNDGKIKYGFGLLKMFNKNPRRAYGIYYKSDLEQLGQSIYALKEDNIVASVFRRNPNNKLSYVKEFKTFYEHEWKSGFSNKLYFIHRDVYPRDGVDFRFNLGSSNEVKNFITTSEITLQTRFAYREKLLLGEFERISLGSKYPILEIYYTKGIKNLWNSDYNYQKIQFNITHWFNIGTYGYSKYIIDAGQIFGTLPYPLLKLHEGNETYSFDEYAFNTMNYYEFASDRYLSVYYTHHFDGFFLNRVPLMRKLKWREVGLIKGLVGEMSDANKQFSVFPSTLNSLTKPYFEAGVGIENIFKVLRIDGLWRLSYLNNPDISLFGLRVTFQIYF